MNTRTFVVVVILSLLSAAAAAPSEKKIHLKDLPAPVKQALEEQSKGATLRGLATEVENGKTLYEAELMVNGHGKDVTFDNSGAVVSVEEETTLEAIPAGAREAVRKAVGKGKLVKLEVVTENGATAYEAHIRRGIRSSEVKVDAAGQPVK